MHTTPVSLLQRLQRPASAEAWERFVQLYTPLLYSWAGHLGVPSSERGDLLQEVFLTLLRSLPSYELHRRRSFRGWLRVVLHNKLRELHRRRSPAHAGAGPDLDELADSGEADRYIESEYRRHLVQQALRLMQAEFKPVTWRACWDYVVEGRQPDEVAQALGISVNAVYLAKSRVLRRLREELAGLWE